MIAFYAPAERSRAVPLPVSTPDILVLELTAEPPDLRQSFTPEHRHLHLPADHVPARVLCRLRLFRERASRGEERPWPTPQQLFPGASRVVENEIR
ncbi:MAG: hypothetical protein KDC87_14605 [Planctomycetes bacterium]|nr:hypothetical protein [Planctomycetota bacterium]MCB9869713.1 hypothetical protein [Planctomycetota bacterium]